MSKVQRVKNLITGIIMIICAAVMVLAPEFGYSMVVAILSVSMFLVGIRSLLYYFFMARHMVGGQIMLYKGIILFDLGMLSMMLTSLPKVYVIIYLAAVNLLSGGMDMLGAIDARRMGGSWRLKFAAGLVSIVIALGCIAFAGNTEVMVCFYCIGLVYSAVLRIISSFRRTAIVYVQ